MLTKEEIKKLPEAERKIEASKRRLQLKAEKERKEERIADLEAALEAERKA